jgi:arsenate reductase
MAEALVNHYMADSWLAYSAGTHPSYVHPLAVRALKELNISTERLRSKSISEFWEREDLDLVVTVCDHAKRRCPTFYKEIPGLHIAFDDPVSYNAKNDDEAMAGFREVRDDILKRLLPKLQELA